MSLRCASTAASSSQVESSRWHLFFFFFSVQHAHKAPHGIFLGVSFKGYGILNFVSAMPRLLLTLWQYLEAYPFLRSLWVGQTFLGSPC
jgi:hypothetical protein